MKRIACLCLSILIVMGMVIVPISADEPAPCYVNTLSTTTNFGIWSDGEAFVMVSYLGYEDRATSAEITVQIQKKTLGLFWTDVSNRSWTINAYGYRYAEEIIFQLSSKGTYRAVVNYTIYGFGGGPDVTESICQDKYE